MLDYSIVAFKDLQDHHFELMQKMFDDALNKKVNTITDSGYVFDPTDYRNATAFKKNLGRVFFIKNEECSDIIGFSLCFDSIDLTSARDYPIYHISRFLEHEWEFIQDLSKIGHFSFVNQIIIDTTHRKNGYGIQFVKYLFKFYESKAVTVGTVIHQWQHGLLKVLQSLDIIFVDGYIAKYKSNQYREALWYRMIKIIKIQEFYRKISPDTIPETFSTVIPIQLNLTTSNINRLVKNSNNARIIWSCFFQYKYPILDKIMKDKFYMGYYQPLLESSEEDFPKVTNSIKEIIRYLNIRDTDANAPSLSRSLSSGGFEFFLLDKKDDDIKFDSFANPKVYDLSTFNYDKIAEDDKFIVNDDLSYEESRSRWEEWINLHKVMYASDQTIMKEGERWCHTVIPISFSSRGVMGVMSTFIYKQTKDNPALVNDLAITISDALSKNMFNIILKIQQKEMLHNLMKFAIATIMSRNLSHNFGSHILAKLSSANTIKDIISKNYTTPEKEIAEFNSYIRTRMDFLADISTSEPVNSIPRKLNTQVLQKFDDAKLVKKNISGTDLKDVKIAYRNTINKENPQEDVVVQIPNGILGQQAIFIIIENIIRNSVKHEKPENLKKIKINVEVHKYEDNKKSRGYIIYIYDNIPRVNEKAEDLKDLLNSKYINEPIIERKHKIRAFGWGIIEMKAAACYLRKKYPAKYIDIKNKPNILRAIRIPIKEGGNTHSYVGYRIYLKKPREILFLDLNGRMDTTNLTEWINNGIKVSSFTEIRQSSFETQTHEIAVLLDNLDVSAVPNKKYYPLRWVKLHEESKIKEIENLLNQNPQQAILEIWKKWIHTFLTDRNIKQNISLKISSELVTYKHELNLFNASETTIICFDHHGDFRSNRYKNFAYYEAFTSGSPTGTLILHIHELNKHELNRQYIELIEAALTNVVILDERIQNGLTEFSPYAQYYEDEDNFDHLRMMNIQVPRIEELNMFSESFGEKEKENMINWLTVSSTKKSIDFLVIHQGIIERVVGTSKVEIDQYINAIRQAVNSNAEIIIISGRGKPHELPEDILFLNYSNIAQSVLDQRSKYHLCKILYSARSTFKYGQL